MYSRLLIVLVVSSAIGCSSAKPSTSASPSVASAALLPQFIVPNGPNSPFSPVVRVGNLLFVSGQLGTSGASQGIKGETTAAMTRIGELLKQSGSSLDRVAKCTVMLADMKDWAAMNEAYDAFFPKHRPARSAFGATALAMGGRVEIECIATVD